MVWYNPALGIVCLVVAALMSIALIVYIYMELSGSVWYQKRMMRRDEVYWNSQRPHEAGIR